MKKILSSLSKIYTSLKKRSSSKLEDKTCEICGGKDNVSSYSGSSTDTTRGYCEVFKNFIYKEPINLCFQCLLAHESFLRKIKILVLNPLNHKNIEDAKKSLGSNAVEILALLDMARDDINSIERILTKEELVEMKPWLKNQIELEKKYEKNKRI